MSEIVKIKQGIDALDAGVFQNLCEMYLSSNITPSQDNSIKHIGSNVGIMVTLIGIDKLANDLYFYHHH